MTRDRLHLAVLLCLSGCGGGQDDPDATDAVNLPPATVVTTPADGAVDVPIASLVGVQFSRAMVPASLTVAFTPSVALAATTWSESDDAVTLFPAAPLAAATRYTVDVAGTGRDGAAIDGLSFAFTTDDTADTTAPEILDFLPGDEAACDSDVSIAFSEPIDPRTLVIGSRRSLGPPTWSAGLRRVTFAQTPTWASASQFDVDVTAADLAGNVVSHRFTFWSCPLPVALPLVTATYPSPGETGVPSDAHLRITFSEPMDTGPTRFAVTTSPPLACLRYVPPKFLGHFDDTNRTFTCYEGAAPNTTYTVTVHGASDAAAADRATSQAGVLLASNYTFTFSTGPDPFDNTAPRLAALFPPDGTRDAPVGTAVVIEFDEEMDPTSGTLGIATASFVDRSWNTPPTQVTYRFGAEFPYGADLAYTLTNFRDAVGNTMPAATASFSTPGRTVSMAASDAARDGTIERPGGARASGAAIFVGVTGATTAQKDARGLLSFTLPPALLAHTGVTIERAYLIVDQASASLSPLAAHNPMHATSVSLGAGLDAVDYDGAPLSGNVDALDVFDGATVGLHALDVTNAVAYDLAYRADRGGRSELRLAFEHERDGALAAGIVGLAAGESLTPPQLWIDYTYSR